MTKKENEVTPVLLDRYLEGDARQGLMPNLALQHFGNPIGVTRAEARKWVKVLREAGVTQHSGTGKMIWVLQEWCLLNGKEFTVDVATVARCDKNFNITGKEILGYVFRLVTPGKLEKG